MRAHHFLKVAIVKIPPASEGLTWQHDSTLKESFAFGKEIIELPEVI